MTWRTAARARDDQKRQQHWLRVQGYDDGYAGRPATSTVAVYQAAWRRGRQAREALADWEKETLAALESE